MDGGEIAGDGGREGRAGVGTGLDRPSGRRGLDLDREDSLRLHAPSAAMWSLWYSDPTNLNPLPGNNSINKLPH